MPMAREEFELTPRIKALGKK
jgi:hypothetical protein